MHTLVIVFVWLLGRLRGEAPAKRPERPDLTLGWRRSRESAHGLASWRMNVGLELELSGGPPDRRFLTVAAPGSLRGRFKSSSAVCRFMGAGPAAFLASLAMACS